MSESCLCAAQCADCRSQGILPHHLNPIAEHRIDMQPLNKAAQLKHQTLVALMLAAEAARKAGALDMLVEHGFMTADVAQAFTDAVIVWVEC